VKRFAVALASVMLLAFGLSGTTGAQEQPKPVTLPDGGKTEEGAKDESGKWVLPDGSPTYHITKEGTVDWYTWSGFRRYHSECHVCHGPEGEGSSYAPALVSSLKTMSYADFLAIVASGRTTEKGGTTFVMPALGDNKNVMCYVEDIYVYLKARADGAQPRGRPAGRADAPQQFKDNEKTCLGG